MSDHITLELLRQIHAGEREASDLAASALGHLLEICPECRRAIEAWRDQATPQKESTAGAPPRERLTARIGDDSVAPWLDELLKYPPPEWSARVKGRSHLISATTLAEELLSRVRDLLPFHPREICDLASLGCAVMSHESSTPGNTALYALLLAHQANAWRIQEDLEHAESLMESAAFIQSTQTLDGPTPDPVVRAQFDWLEAALRRSQRRLREAECLLKRSVGAYLAAGCDLDAAKGLISLGGVYNHGGLYSQEEAVLCRASKILARSENSSFFAFCVAHNRIHLFALRGKASEARSLFVQSQEIYASVQDPMAQLRKTWADGLIEALEGHFRSARRKLRLAQEGFTHYGRAYTSAMVGKDLAALHAQQGQLQQTERTINEIIPVFEDKDVHFEADAARKILRDALAGRRDVN